MCLGNEFACITMWIFLHYMVLNYEWSMVDPNEKFYVFPTPTFRKGLQFKLHNKKFNKIKANFGGKLDPLKKSSTKHRSE
jgi:hypothetical protein